MLNLGMFSLKYIFACLLIFMPLEIYAARAGDRIQKLFEFTPSCSQVLISVFKLDADKLVAGVTFPVLSAISEVSLTNEIKLVDDKLTLGMNWQDNSGAIPRSAGPRYSFFTPKFTEIDKLDDFWKAVYRSLGVDQDTLKKASRLVAKKVICEGADNITVTLYKFLGYVNQYGSEPDSYLIGIATGEELPAIQQSGMYER